LFPDLLADENIDFRIIENLRVAGFNVFSVRENCCGAKDREILNIAKLKKLIIVTEDKDFGELIFSYNEANVGVIFLRYHFLERTSITESLIRIIRKYEHTLYNKFTVLTPKKIRMRDI
jgi:predicted nuclease of predicted toxin-antitoxin system